MICVLRGPSAISRLLAGVNQRDERCDIAIESRTIQAGFRLRPNVRQHRRYRRAGC